MANKKLTFANIITVSGLITLMPLVYFLIKDSGLGVLLCVAWIIFSDTLDGIIARKFNQITLFGKIVDPIRDRLLLVVMFFYFIVKSESLLIIWLIVLTIFVEITSTITKTIIYKRYSIIDHTLVGQARMTVHSIVILYIIVNQYWFKLAWPALEECLLVIFFASFFALLSHYEQLRKIKQISTK